MKTNTYNLRHTKQAAPAAAAALAKPKQLNDGRWSKKESKLFEEAFEMFGKNWKKIKQHVGTRTGMQIRSHGQKYIKKLHQTHNHNSQKSG